MAKIIGKVENRIIDLLGLTIKQDSPILLGDSNIAHMRSEHPEDFEKYFAEIENILASPDYVSLHPKDGSIQYIKLLDVHVLVGVRVSSKGTLFARSIYNIKQKRFENYMRAGTLKKY